MTEPLIGRAGAPPSGRTRQDYLRRLREVKARAEERRRDYAAQQQGLREAATRIRRASQRAAGSVKNEEADRPYSGLFGTENVGVDNPYGGSMYAPEPNTVRVPSYFSSDSPVSSGFAPDQPLVELSDANPNKIFDSYSDEYQRRQNLKAEQEASQSLSDFQNSVGSAGGGGGPTIGAHPGWQSDPNMVDTIMKGLRLQESGGNYQAHATGSDASGAYQYISTTWNGYDGYAEAADAPPAVQDQRVRSDLLNNLAKFGDWEYVIAAHFAGAGGFSFDKSQWNVVPGYSGNPTIRSYVDGVLSKAGLI